MLMRMPRRGQGTSPQQHLRRSPDQESFANNQQETVGISMQSMLPTPHDFQSQLSQAEIPWRTDDNFCDFVKKTKNLTRLFQIALKGGPRYTGEFYNWYSRAIDNKLKSASKDIPADQEEAWITGDVEFDKFRDMIRRHNWQWDYSNDANELRRGHERVELIEAIARAKGGIYRTAWEYAKRRYAAQAREEKQSSIH